jgi:hypothetical protein
MRIVFNSIKICVDEMVMPYAHCFQFILYHSRFAKDLEEVTMGKSLKRKKIKELRYFNKNIQEEI